MSARAPVEISREQLLAIVDKAALTAEERATLRDAIETLAELTVAIESKRTTIGRLRRMLFGAPTEKTSAVLKDGSANAQQGTEATKRSPKRRAKGKGHGRHRADDYEGAEHRHVNHESLAPGDQCPACGRGSLYELAKPARVVRVRGQAPITAIVAELQRLRCSGCGKVFRPKTPADLAGPKYDESVASIIAVTKYGNGLPFHRLERMQRGFGIPLAATTQWDLVNEHARDVEVAHQELMRQAAQCDVMHNDDTGATILALGGKPGMGDELEGEATETEKARTSVQTSTLVCTRQGRRIALFFTGRRNAGENLTALLRRRAADCGPPIQMCDGLSHNLPTGFATILSNCLTHARRRFVDVKHAFPSACRVVLETLRDVYHHDAVCKAQGMSAEDRLAYHQEHSSPRMAALESWLHEQFHEKKVEPNSSLGEAIGYMRKRWRELTLFLRVPGAPLDNNIAERVLKKAILHRKNALFFKSVRGAQVADLFMSLIHTAELAGVDPFDYLISLRRHRTAVQDAPADWMPWNYRETRERLLAPS